MHWKLPHNSKEQFIQMTMRADNTIHLKIQSEARKYENYL